MLNRILPFQKRKKKFQVIMKARPGRAGPGFDGREAGPGLKKIGQRWSAPDEC